MTRHLPFLSAIILASIPLSWPASALARPDGDPWPASILVAQMGDRLARSDAPSADPAGLPWDNGLNVTDRFDLANRKIWTREQGIGPVDVTLSAGRAFNGALHSDTPYAIDHWTLKFLGASASWPILPGVALVMEWEYARMARRLSVLEVTPHRLATGIARVGGGLSLGKDARLMLDYMSVARSRRQDDLTRMAEALGGAPATGHGPQLSFTWGSGSRSGQADWRFSLASLQRPMRDLGLAADGEMRHDARALLSFNLHL